MTSIIATSNSEFHSKVHRGLSLTTVGLRQVHDAISVYPHPEERWGMKFGFGKERAYEVSL
jgi:hypothetical protein